MEDIREFDKADWNSLAGCEVLGDGSPPLIVEVEETLYIADGTGVTAVDPFSGEECRILGKRVADRLEAETLLRDATRWA